jgi:hypothetical protein
VTEANWPAEKSNGPTRVDGEPHPLDVVRGVVQPDDPTGEDAAGMDDQVVLVEPGDLAVRPRHGAAGEDQAARLLLVGQANSE